MPMKLPVSSSKKQMSMEQTAECEDGTCGDPIDWVNLVASNQTHDIPH